MRLAGLRVRPFFPNGGVAERGSCGIEAAVPVSRLSLRRGRPHCWAKAQTLRPWQFGFPGVPTKTKKTEFLTGTPKEMAAKLVEKLKFEARVI